MCVKEGPKKMIQKKWKVTFGVLGIATFFFLWAALNLCTGRAYSPGIEKPLGGGGGSEPAGLSSV